MWTSPAVKPRSGKSQFRLLVQFQDKPLVRFFPFPDADAANLDWSTRAVGEALVRKDLSFLQALGADE